ncbi:MAG: transposase [Sphingomonadales bacterium]|nr:transposase [Sphingomonadales bacterium]
MSLADASGKIEAWRLDYNECRPHRTRLDDPANEGRRLTLNRMQIGTA